MPKRPSAAARGVLQLLMVIVLAAGARADDLPATLPDAPADRRLLDEDAERERRDDLPATLPDDEPTPVSDSGPPPIRFEASVNAAFSVPIARNPDGVGFGFAVTYGAGWGEIPLALGIDFISVGSIADAESQVDVALEDGIQVADRLVSTRLMHFDAWLRLQPAHFWVRPYAEGFFGAQLFQGKYLLRLGNEESERAQADDWGRNMGWGVGVEFLQLFGGMSFTLGMRQVYADKVKVARQVVLSNERVSTRYEADTSVLLFMIGIGLHYDLADPPPNNQLLGR
jgi:hypothetical protein